MVVFTCAHCGDSVKKPKVEKHYQTVCSRNPISLTCIDCCKDFRAETYPAHTKCVTEEERYSAKGFQPKPSSNKGEQKQQKWQEVIETMRSSYEGSLSQNERFILDVLVKHENVPRKKNKFQNFLRNAMKNRFCPNAADSIFDKLEAQNKSGDGEKSKENKQEEEKENTSVEMKEGNPAEEKVVEEEKLSKKEKKEKRKRAKYEAELKEIESNQVEAEAEDEGISEGKKKKKSKKGEAVEAVENGIEEEEEKPKKKKKKTHLEENGIEENGVSEEVEVTESKKSKKKHRKEKDGIVENGGVEDAGEEEGKKSKKKEKDTDEPEAVVEEKTKKKRKKQAVQEEEEPCEKKAKESCTDNAAEEEPSSKSGKSKFNWQDMIVQVLTAKEEKEMSLKKLRKKILAEFESMGCGSATDEKTIAKFNKKVQHTPGVVVLKDTAKLVATE